MALACCNNRMMAERLAEDEAESPSRSVAQTGLEIKACVYGWDLLGNSWRGFHGAPDWIIARLICNCYTINNLPSKHSHQVLASVDVDTEEETSDANLSKFGDALLRNLDHSTHQAIRSEIH